MNDVLKEIREALSEPDVVYTDYFGEEYTEEYGTWRVLEKMPLNEPKMVEGHSIVKVDQDLSYSEGAYENDVEMVFSLGDPVTGYYKVTGWADSYGTTYWNSDVDRVFPKVVTKVVYGTKED